MAVLPLCWRAIQQRDWLRVQVLAVFSSFTFVIQILARNRAAVISHPPNISLKRSWCYFNSSLHVILTCLATALVSAPHQVFSLPANGQTEMKEWAEKYHQKKKVFEEKHVVAVIPADHKDLRLAIYGTCQQPQKRSVYQNIPVRHLVYQINSNISIISKCIKLANTKTYLW